MYNPIDSIANVLKSGAGALESLGSATTSIIKEASRGYAQKDGETNEAYRMRLEFLEKKEQFRQDNKNRRQENKSQKKLAHKELKILKCQEKKETKILTQQDKIQGKDDR